MPKLVVVFGSLMATAGMLVMRHGGQGVDFSNGIVRGLCDGYVWLIGIAMTWVAGLVFALYVTRAAISDALSFYVPLTYTFTFIGGILFLREPISTTKILGSVFILVGLLFMLRSS